MKIVVKVAADDLTDFQAIKVYVKPGLGGTEIGSEFDHAQEAQATWIVYRLWRLAP